MCNLHWQRWRLGRPILSFRDQFIRENPPKDGIGVIPLTQGAVAIVDEADYWDLIKFPWCLQSGGYACRRERISRTMILMHRQSMGETNGMEIDHLNHKRLDNRRCNLRPATRFQNSCNTIRSDGRSIYKGVYHDERGSFAARITWNKKCISIGRFDTEKDAARAYNAFAKLLHGEFGILNDVD